MYFFLMLWITLLMRDSRPADAERKHLGMKRCACDCAGSYGLVLGLHPWRAEVCGRFNWPHSAAAARARCVQVELLFSLLTKPLIHPETGGQVSAGAEYWALVLLPLPLLVVVVVAGGGGWKGRKNTSLSAMSGAEPKVFCIYPRNILHIYLLLK